MSEKKPEPPAEAAPAAAAEAPAEGVQPAAPKKKIGTLTLVIAALASFVVFLGVFSYMMGVFDPKPEATETSVIADSTATPAHTGTSGFASPYGEATAAIDAAEKAKAIDTALAISILDRRQRDLTAQEKEIERKKRELEALRSEIETLLDKRQTIADEKATYIARLLDGMKPDEMSGLMANLDNATILAVMPRMKPATASRVLAQLPPERAAKITTELLATPEVKSKP